MPRLITKALRANEFWVFLVIAALTLVIQARSGQFYTANNLVDLAGAMVVPGLFAVAAHLVLVSGGIDVSFPALASLAVYMTTKMLVDNGWNGPVIVPFLIAAALGAILGAFNGIFTSRLTVPTLIITLGTANVFNGVMQGALKSVQINTIPESMRAFGLSSLFVARNESSGLQSSMPVSFLILVAVLKIPPILATLGTLELFGGVALILTEGKPVSGVPTAFGMIFTAKVAGLVPVPLVVFLVCAAVAGAIVAFTGFGTTILMLGTNDTAARFSGLKVTSLLIRTYVLSGVMAAMAGIVMLANYNSAKADYGASYTLLTVLIVVLGGVNPNGGSGRLSGVLLSILTLQVLSSGLNMFPNISNFYRPLIWGGVLLLVICMNEGLFSFASLRRLMKGRSHADS